MEPNLYLCRRSREIALKTTSVYVDGFSTRLLPIFDHTEEEASAETEKAWETAMSSPAGDENCDLSSYAEAVREYGIEVYENLQFTRQQLLGLASAGLYHLWERLLKQFFCKELRGWTFSGREVHKLIDPANFSDLERFLSQFGFQLAKQTYYTDLCEILLVANVVKHGDGRACEKLQASAPHLFGGYRYHFDIHSKSDSLELRPADFTRYAKAVTDFWDTFPENLTLVAAD
jgi:hypothetical protein